MYHRFLIHSSADGHLGCFHVLAIINKKNIWGTLEFQLEKSLQSELSLVGSLKDPLKILLTFKNFFLESVLMRWMKLEPIIQSEVSQKEKHQYSILTHIYGI